MQCDLCNCEKSSLFLEKPDRFGGEVFQYRSCDSCGLIYLFPRPSQSEIVNYYPGEYECYQTTDDSHSFSTKWHKKQALKRQLEFVDEFVKKPGRLLDVGCATGEFIHYTRDQGWEVEGIEISESAAGIARRRFNLNVTTGSLESTKLREDSYDVVTFWDVLEHLPSPKFALQETYRILKPSGVVIFSIPNLESFDRYLFANHWIGWDAPRHLFLFSGSSIKRMINESGYKILRRKCFLGGKGTFNLSIEEYSKNIRFGHILTKYLPALSAFLWPYRQLAYLLNKGPIITYAIRKI